MAADFSPFLYPILGGLLIGLSATLSLLLLGRIAGISGIIWGAFAPRGLEARSELEDGAGGEFGFEPGRLWRLLFLMGLVLGSLVFHIVTGRPMPVPSDNAGLAIVAGLLVGIGVKLGSGCTSGHGVCGIGRLSLRSLLATCLFMFAAIVTVAVIRLAGISV